MSDSDGSPSSLDCEKEPPGKETESPGPRSRLDAAFEKTQAGIPPG